MPKRCPAFDAGAIEASFELSRSNLRVIEHLSLNSLEITADNSYVAISRDVLSPRGQLCP